MASTISFRTIALVLILSSSQFALSIDFSINNNDDENGVDHYVVDRKFIKFQPEGYDKIKWGAHCNSFSKNICNGIQVNNGTGLLHCCKTHCRDVLRDRNNCGRCGNKCGFGEKCCNGTCTNVSFNAHNCGKCKRNCSPGIKCEFGVCGYA